MLRTFDHESDWGLRLGEVKIGNYDVVFGYVHIYSDIYIRLYESNNGKQIFGRKLSDLAHNRLKDFNDITVNITNMNIIMSFELFEKIRIVAERLSKLKAFA